MTKQIKEKCKNVKLVITDVDGILTDGGMYYSESGEELKKFNVRDGIGAILLKNSGIKIGAFTGEPLELNERRLKKIGFDFMFKSVSDKLSCLNKYLEENNLKPENVAYIGDEINDYCLLDKVGVFFTVPDANPIIKEKADHILETAGGDGALREAALTILSAQGKLQQALESYLERSKQNGTNIKRNVFIPFSRGS